MYFKEKHCVTSILHMYVFDLLTINYPNKNIWHNLDWDKYNCNEEINNNHKGSFQIMQRTSNLTMHKVRQPTAVFLAKDTVYALSEVHLFLEHL